jgi:hypothetical protein
VLGQLLAILQLRWIIFRNLWFNSGAGVLSGLIRIVMMIGAVLLALGLTLALTILGRMAGEADAVSILIGCDVAIAIFLFFWLTFLMIELQRSEVVDVRKLMHLPITLRRVFALNFGMSLFTPGVLLFCMPTTGFVLGMAGSRGAPVLFALFGVAAFILALAAWTFYFRGWLSAMMEDKRKRRWVMTILPLGFMVVGYGPFLLMRGGGELFKDYVSHQAVESGQARPNPSEHRPGSVEHREAVRELQELSGSEDAAVLALVVRANAWVPVGWLPLTVYALDTGRYGVALASTSGLSVIALGGLAWGYRGTRKYYQGTSRKKKRKTPQAVKDVALGNPAERNIPFVDNATAGIAWVTFLTFTRTPAVRMMLISAAIFGCVMFAFFSFGKISESKEMAGIGGAFALVGLVIWPCLFLSGILLNLFGFDREGFSAYIFAPVERHRYLLAKNLATAPLIVVMVTVFLVLGGIRMGLSPVAVGVALLQGIQFVLCLCIVGNFWSILFPTRVNLEVMRGNAGFSKNHLTGFLTLLIFPFLALPTVFALIVDPILITAVKYQGLPIGPFVALLFLGVTVVMYRLSLGVAGRLLQRREQRIFEQLVHTKE